MAKTTQVTGTKRAEEIRSKWMGKLVTVYHEDRTTVRFDCVRVYGVKVHAWTSKGKQVHMAELQIGIPERLMDTEWVSETLCKPYSPPPVADTGSEFDDETPPGALDVEVK